MPKSPSARRELASAAGPKLAGFRPRRPFVCRQTQLFLPDLRAHETVGTAAPGKDALNLSEATTERERAQHAFALMRPDFFDEFVRRPRLGQHGGQNSRHESVPRGLANLDRSHRQIGDNDQSTVRRQPGNGAGHPGVDRRDQFRVLGWPAEAGPSARINRRVSRLINDSITVRCAVAFGGNAWCRAARFLLNGAAIAGSIATRVSTSPSSTSRVASSKAIGFFVMSRPRASPWSQQYSLVPCNWARLGSATRIAEPNAPCSTPPTAASRRRCSHQRSIGSSLSTPLTMTVAPSGMRNRSANSAREVTCDEPVARLTNS